MKVPVAENGHHYTAAEIVQILERARALGVRFLRVGGFEATWGLEHTAIEIPNPRSAEESAPLSHQRGWEERPKPEGVRRAENLCNVCGNEKVLGKFGKPYCVSCFIEKKERAGK